MPQGVALWRAKPPDESHPASYWPLSKVARFQAGREAATFPIAEIQCYSRLLPLPRLPHSPIPGWFRMKTDNKIHYNKNRR